MTRFPEIITIEVRNPRTKRESERFGLTWTNYQTANIFINAKKNRRRIDLKDTLLHELYHAAVGLYRFSRKNEERIARMVGESARGC